MKPIIYARLSLLIPLVVWAICISVIAIASVLFKEELSADESSSFLAGITMFILFYVFGILFWFLPYLVLATVLFLLSLKFRVPILKPLFVLSPLGMAFIIMLVVALITSTFSDGTLVFSDFAGTYQETLGVSGLFGIVTLMWGYICVGLGFGLYKLLQVGRIIHDGVIPGSEPVLPAIAS